MRKKKRLVKMPVLTLSDHFAGVGKTICLGSSSQREIEDIDLTSYACSYSAKRQCS